MKHAIYIGILSFLDTDMSQLVEALLHGRPGARLTKAYDVII